VSVSVCLQRGALTGRLVKESGQLSGCSNEEDWMKFRGVSGNEFGLSQLGKAYLVIEASCSISDYVRRAAFGELSVENLEVLTSCVGYLWRTEGEGFGND
jgi:hypothetical protein